MPKTLTQRIADRVAKQDKGATKKNRAVFLALRSEVEEAMKDGWPIKTIWETLHDEGRVTFSYQAFRLYVNRLIVQGSSDNQANAPGQAPPAEAVIPASKAIAAPAPTTLQPTGPVLPKPPEITGFDFNTKPQTKDLI